MTSTLCVESVSKYYLNTCALDEVSMSIEAGEIVALVGPNGAGKTTLLSTIAGLIQPDSGSMTIATKRPSHGPAHARRRRRSHGAASIGFAPQDIALYLTLTARENLEGFGTLHRPSREVRASIDRVSEALDLAHLLDKQVRALSSGEQRRVHVAAAVLHDPPLLLLDEPTAGVDIGSRERLLTLVRDLAFHGAAVCYSTHYLAELDSFADRVVMLDHGRVVANRAADALVGNRSASLIKITFSAIPPQIYPSLPSADLTTVTDDTIEILTHRPAHTLQTVFAALGDDVAKITEMEMVRPGIETALADLPVIAQAAR
jgi:ABC-2 type transport system ATP-binding protein